MQQLSEVACSLCGSRQHRRLYQFDFHSFGVEAPFVLVRCGACGHVYNTPRLVTIDLNQLYNRNYHKPGDKYNEHRGWILSVADYLNEVRPWEGALEGRELLDIGCGMGFFLKVCRDNGWQVKGVDVSRDGVSFARTTLGLDVTLSRFEDYDPGPYQFDFIAAFDLLEHMEDPVGFVNRCCSLLKPGGLLVMETPNINSIYRGITRRYWVGFNPYHIRFFVPETMRRLASLSQLRVIDMHSTFNDLFSKRNVWRWCAHLPALGPLLNSFWRWRKKTIDYTKSPDISSIETRIEALRTKIDLDSLIERRNNWIGRHLLGDQLVAVFKKPGNPE